MASLCYANRHLTDGFISVKALPAVFPGVSTGRLVKLAVALVEAKLWEKRDDGWQIHDYLHFQPSAAEIREESLRSHEARVKAGRLGGLAKAVRSRELAGGLAKASKPLAKPKQTPSKRLAKPSSVAVSVSEAVSVAVSVSEPREEEQNNLGAPAPEVRQVFDAYYEHFERRYGEKPTINGGKDGANVKRLLHAYGLDKVLELLRRFFESPDPFIVSTGHGLGIFTSSNIINRLLTQGSAPILTSKTAGNAEAVRRFVEGRRD